MSMSSHRAKVASSRQPEFVAFNSTPAGTQQSHAPLYVARILDALRSVEHYRRNKLTRVRPRRALVPGWDRIFSLKELASVMGDFSFRKKTFCSITMYL